MKYEIIKGYVYLVQEYPHSKVTNIYGSLRRIHTADLTYVGINSDMDIELKREIFDVDAGKYVVEADNNEPLKVVLDGEEHTLNVENGVATIDFMSGTKGMFKLVSMCEVSKNCEVEICVTKSE